MPGNQSTSSIFLQTFLEEDYGPKDQQMIFRGSKPAPLIVNIVIYCENVKIHVKYMNGD